MITHKYPHRVRYRECDRMGLVYHVHFLDHFEAGRTELIRSIGIPYGQIEDSGLLIQVVEVNVPYHQPAYYDDDLEITTIIDEIPETRLNLRNEIRRVGESEVLVSGRSTLCFVDRERGKPARVPDYFSEAIRRELGRAAS